MNTEEWMDVTGYEGIYKVSTEGNILSLLDVHRRKPKPHLIKPGMKSGGYLGVTLGNGITQRSFLLHRIVAAQFIPNPEGKPQVNHKNGVKSDNRVSNLEWATKSENMIHAYSTGLMANIPKGVNRWNAKLNHVKVEAIRALIRKGKTQGEIAEEHGVNQSVVSRIKHDKAWKHVSA